jgi:hypothetical protein
MRRRVTFTDVTDAFVIEVMLVVVMLLVVVTGHRH